MCVSKSAGLAAAIFFKYLRLWHQSASCTEQDLSGHNMQLKHVCFCRVYYTTQTPPKTHTHTSERGVKKHTESDGVAGSMCSACSCSFRSHPGMMRGAG